MPQSFNFFVFNIKLQSKRYPDGKTEAYIELFKQLTEKPYKIFPVGKNEGIVIYESYKYDGSKDASYLYGRAAKGFYIQGETRKVFKDGDIIDEVNDENSLINPQVVRYLFYPDAHRLFVEKRAKGPNQYEIEGLLNATLSKMVLPEEIIEIVLEKDETTIQQIFEARVVHSVTYKVSYTNDDFLDDLADDYDKELKEGNIGEITVTAKADNNNEGLKVNESRLLGGGLKLAEKNGEIKNAIIDPIDSNKKYVRINNKNKPKILNFLFEEKDNFLDRWFKTVQNIYRSN